MQHTMRKSSVSIQVSSQPPVILTSNLCTVNQDYLGATAHAACFGKPNLYL